MFFSKTASVSSLSMEEARRELSRDPSICLVDVRTEDEYASGHIPGSIHLPLHRLSSAPGVVPGKDTRVFVYCLSGARSRQACLTLAKLGYTNVTNIGGILDWSGKIERMVGV